MMVVGMPKRVVLDDITVNFGGAQIRPVYKDEGVGCHARSGVTVGEPCLSGCAKMARHFSRSGEDFK